VPGVSRNSTSSSRRSWSSVRIARAAAGWISSGGASTNGLTIEGRGPGCDGGGGETVVTVESPGRAQAWCARVVEVSQTAAMVLPTLADWACPQPASTHGKPAAAPGSFRPEIPHKSSAHRSTWFVQESGPLSGPDVDGAGSRLLSDRFPRGGHDRCDGHHRSPPQQRIFAALNIFDGRTSAAGSTVVHFDSIAGTRTGASVRRATKCPAMTGAHRARCCMACRTS